jgi:hypothetical protein
MIPDLLGFVNVFEPQLRALLFFSVQLDILLDAIQGVVTKTNTRWGQQQC